MEREVVAGRTACGTPTIRIQQPGAFPMQIRLVPPYNRRAPKWSVVTFVKDPIMCAWKEEKRKRFLNPAEARAFAESLALENDAELIEVAPRR